MTRGAWANPADRLAGRVLELLDEAQARSDARAAGCSPCRVCGRTPIGGEVHARTVPAGPEPDDVEWLCTTAAGVPITPVGDPFPLLRTDPDDPPPF